jgi:hypothetical protein
MRTKLPHDGDRGCRLTIASAKRTAQLAPSNTGIVQRWHGDLRSHLAWLPCNRSAAKYDDFCRVELERWLAFSHHAGMTRIFRVGNVGDRHIERPNTDQSAGEPRVAERGHDCGVVTGHVSGHGILHRVSGDRRLDAVSTYWEPNVAVEVAGLGRRGM